jgi:hypothetical protein
MVKPQGAMMDYQGEKKNWALEDKMRRQRDAYLDAVRRELYHGKQIPEADMEKILRPVGLWQEYGRTA